MPTWSEVEYSAVATVQRHPEIRMGQAIFNALYSIDPATANYFRGTRYDCFYIDDRIEKFRDAVIQHWLYKEQ